MDPKDACAGCCPTDESLEPASSSSRGRPRLPYHFGGTASLLADDAAPFPFLTSLKFVASTDSSSNGSQHIQALEQTLGLIDSILHPQDHRSAMMSLTDPPLSPIDMDPAGSLSLSNDARPKSFLHDEMNEFNLIFSELVASPQRRFPFRDTGLVFKLPGSPYPSEADSLGSSSPIIVASVAHKAPKDENNISSQGLLRIKRLPLDVQGHELTSDAAVNSVPSSGETFQEGSDGLSSEPVSCIPPERNEDKLFELRETDRQMRLSPRRHSEGGGGVPGVPVAGALGVPASLTGQRLKGFASLDALQCSGHREDGGKICDTLNEDDADSGYMTGDSSVLAMVAAAKKLEATAAVSRDELLLRIDRFNLNRQGLVMSLLPESNVFQGNIRVHMNLYRPIKMSLSSRPSSIYDILIRTDARLPENESSVASFRLPNNTFKAIHVTSETTTHLVIKTLLNKFNITDNPKRFALYERIIASQEQKDAKVDPLPLSNTLSSVRRLADDDRPLELCLRWADHGLDLLDRCQFVLQENDPGEIMWEAFSLPELNNFLRILAKEELSYAEQIRTKYRLLKREMDRKLHSLDDEKRTKKTS